ncbi:MAG: alanine racemase [Acutalibacteraceae bacterium]
MENYLKRTWAVVDLDSIAHNYRYIKSRLDDGVKVMSVVKADAYGHGAKFVAPLLDRLGTDWFAVSNIEEAMQLRSLGIEKPILILGYTPPFMAGTLADHQISQAVFCLDYARELSAAAADQGKTVRVHIKIDTGMGRIGFIYRAAENGCDEQSAARNAAAIEEITEAHRLPALDFEGIFTHFASADTDGDESGEYTKRQFASFCDIIEKLRLCGIKFRLRHCCNSAATLKNKDMQLDMVRPGIILYGLDPSSYFRGKSELVPAMTLKSIVSMIKPLLPFESVSYGRTYQADKPMIAATVPVGYADGYMRSLSGKGYVMIGGRRADIIGRVCMDQMIVDVTDIGGVRAGDEVLLFGNDGDGALSIDEFAKLCGTINYEIVCIIGKRVTRVYLQNGREVGTLNYVCKLQND